MRADRTDLTRAQRKALQLADRRQARQRSIENGLGKRGNQRGVRP